MQGTHGQGAVQQRVKKRSLQHEACPVACCAQENAGW
jgi:hypothetical protein